MKKDSQVLGPIEVKRIAQGGDGVAHLPDGRVLFVEEAFPGDLLDVEIKRSKKSWARGKVKKILKPSKARVTPECDAYRRGCGGCQFWGVARKDELRWKVEAANDAIQRISKIENLPEPEVVFGKDRYYRSKITLHQVKYEEEEEVRLGFFKTGSKKLVPLQRCLVAGLEINEALEEFGAVLSYLGNGEVVMETAGDGKVVITFRQGPRGVVMPATLNEISRWLEQGQVVAGLEIFDGKGKHFVLGDTTISAAETFAGQPVEALRHRSDLFRQANQEINRRLVDALLEELPSRDQLQVLELFSGMGNFTFPIAETGASVLAAEVSADAVDVARQIVALKESKATLDVQQVDLFEALEVESLLLNHFEVLVLDPPRDGAFEVARQMADHQGCEKILYVSCDPACLARDLRALSEGGWKVQKITFFDMFPRTTHLETFVVLER